MRSVQQLLLYSNFKVELLRDGLTQPFNYKRCLRVAREGRTDSIRTLVRLKL